MQQHEIEARHRALRTISGRQQTDAMSCVSGSGLADLARQLGLAAGRNIVCDSDQEMHLICDLAVHTARPGRSRAIDRYAKSAACAPGTEDALMLAALRQARFSIWRVGARHEVAGLFVTDMLGGEDTWLMDTGLSKSTPPGFLFAGRLAWPTTFAMTCGVIVPVDADAMKEACQSPALRRIVGDGTLNDRGFAVAIYRAALDTGLMANVEFRDIDIAA